MRILAIGDVHGCAGALQTLLEFVQPTSSDTLIMLGDLIDRGPDSNQVIETLIQLQARTNLIVIRGNHDDLLLDSLVRGEPRLLWIGAGGLHTLESYGGKLSDIPASHVEFLENTRDYYETDSNIFVHACVDPDCPMTMQEVATLRWEKLTGEQRLHCSGKQIICGHTSQSSGLPAYNDAAICIDTKAYADGWLTCLDATTGMVWQANTQRSTRGPFPLMEFGSSLSDVL